MSELHPGINENVPSAEKVHKLEPQPKAHESESDQEVTRQQTLEQSRDQIEKEAAKSESIKVGEAESAPLQQAVITKDLQAMNYNRALVRVRKRLALPDKVFSRLIHQPVIDSVSNLAANTIARPSGILAGGLTALVGSSLLLYMARHYGYQYNFLAFAMLFVGGFALGLVLELALRVVRHKQ